MPFPWDVICAFAAFGGHVDVLDWARDRGCPWDEETCASAAEGGHLDVLRWARAKGCPWDEQTTMAEEYGHAGDSRVGQGERMSLLTNDRDEWRGGEIARAVSCDITFQFSVRGG